MKFQTGDLVLFKEPRADGGEDRTPALVGDVSNEGGKEEYLLEYVGWRPGWNTWEVADSICNRRPGVPTHKRTRALVDRTRAICKAIKRARKHADRLHKIADWVKVDLGIHPVIPNLTGTAVGRIQDKCMKEKPDRPGKFEMKYFVKFALKAHDKYDEWLTHGQILERAEPPPKQRGGRGDVFNEIKPESGPELEHIDDVDQLEQLCKALETGQSPARRGEHEVEKIIGRRKVEGGAFEYKVKWLRSSDETWEPLSNLENARAKIEDFNEARRAEKAARKAAAAKAAAAAAAAPAPKASAKPPPAAAQSAKRALAACVADFQLATNSTCISDHHSPNSNSQSRRKVFRH